MITDVDCWAVVTLMVVFLGLLHLTGLVIEWMYNCCVPPPPNTPIPFLLIGDASLVQFLYKTLDF